MKKIKLLFTLFLLITISMQAQVPPNAFNYSAVARDAAGEPIATTTLGIQVSILQSSTIGSAIYVENHFVNTDDFGLFNLLIGAGASQTGTMENIAWDTDNFYLKIGMDANGGTNFLTMGTTQLLSVPYALHSATADSLIGGVNTFSGDYNDLSNQPVTINSITTNEDSLLLSNGQVFANSQSPGFTHYIGEVFGGGVVFQVWKDPSGTEHGLIVDLNDLGGSVWSNLSGYNEVIGVAARGIDGMQNSIAITQQVGHTNSAAALCLNSTNGGFNDWYLPSDLEFLGIINNYSIIAQVLNELPNGELFISVGCWQCPYGYWTSTEVGYGNSGTGPSLAQSIYALRNVLHIMPIQEGDQEAEIGPGGMKNDNMYVRAIRKF